MIGGHDVRDITQASLGRDVAMVLQEPYLFSGPIADNIRYAKAGATRADIIAAATPKASRTRPAKFPSARRAMRRVKPIEIFGGANYPTCRWGVSPSILHTHRRILGCLQLLS